jgi:hypothetical protein
MIALVYDDDEGKGVIFCFDFENGMSINVAMDDESAQDFINIVQNKLNARL